MRPGCLWFIFGGSGAVLILFTILFYLYALPPIVENQVAKTLALKNGTDAWDRFVKTPLPLIFKLFIFEVLNPEEVPKGAKPILKEKGPYVYKEYLTKSILNVNSNKDTITYNQSFKLEFSQELSGNLTEDDLVTVVNPVVVGLNSVVEGLPTVLSTFREILDSALPVMIPGRDQAVAQFKVKEVLFGGIELRCNDTQAMAAFIICSAIRSILPLPIITEEANGNMRVALLQFRNSTPVGPLEVMSGVKDATVLGDLVTWNGKSEVDNWRGDPCNKVRGSDMTLMAPFVDKTKPRLMYSTDICSSSRLVYYKDVTVKGISGYRMTPGPEFFGDSTVYPQNACYCPGPLNNLTEPEGCLKAGVLDIDSCLSVPAVLSQPHFMNADPIYQTPFIGLKPDPKVHSTYLDLEPLTGVPLRGYRRVQVNLKSNPTTAVKAMSDMPHAFFPIIWLEEGMSLDDSLASMLKDQALNVLNIVGIVKWVLIGSGAVIFVAGNTMGVIRLYGFCQ